MDASKTGDFRVVDVSNIVHDDFDGTSTGEFQHVTTLSLKEPIARFFTTSTGGPSCCHLGSLSDPGTGGHAAPHNERGRRSAPGAAGPQELGGGEL